MIATLLTSMVLAPQTPSTAIDYVDLINVLPKLSSADPAIMFRTARIVFAPPGEFTAKAVVEANGKTLVEYPLSQVTRAGSMAGLTFRAPAFTQLGAEDGPRKITVFVNEKPVGVLEFTLTKSTSSDPYNPKTVWTARGPWQTHSYFAYDSETTGQRRINFTYFMATTEIGTEKLYKVDLVMRRGTTILAKSLRPRDINFTDIVRKEEPLHKPDGQPLMQPDLNKMAGPFILEIKQGTRVIRTYRGEIVDGKFKPHSKSALNFTDPTKFLTERCITGGGGQISDFLYTWVTTE